MRVLAVDTALADCQAAVFDVAEDGTATALGQSGGPSASAAEAIVAHAAAALDAAGTPAATVARVITTVGPGSFTGVRVGIAYAKGFAAALGLPAMGATTLEGLARTAGAPAIAVVDARHGAVFAAHFDAHYQMDGLGRWGAGTVTAWAEERGVPLVGPAVAIETLGAGRVVERVDLARLASLARDDPARRPATARYAAAVDAAPQRHKRLARA